MELSRFLELEFQTLRKEIEEANDRAFKLMLGGVTVVPVVQYVAKTFEMDAITLGLPILVIAIALLFLAQNLTIFRAGCYIKDHIEPVIDDFVGWEKWLEQPERKKERRLYDKLMTYSFYVLFLLYYCFSVYLANMAAMTLLEGIAVILLLTAYILIGLGMIFVVVVNLRISTLQD